MFWEDRLKYSMPRRTISSAAASNNARSQTCNLAYDHSTFDKCCGSNSVKSHILTWWDIASNMSALPMRIVAYDHTKLEQFCGVNACSVSTALRAIHSKNSGSRRPMRLVDISPW